jgi:transposase
MSGKRYPDEFKIEAVKQVTDRGYPVADVAARIGVSQHSLYEWIKQFSLPSTRLSSAVREPRLPTRNSREA